MVKENRYASILITSFKHWLKNSAEHADNGLASFFAVSDFLALNSTGSVAIFGNGTLSISHISQSDEGQYICSISNGLGSAKSAEIALKVGGEIP